MAERTLDIGVITDEVSRDLPEALRHAMAWGLRRFELREGDEGRFPHFTRREWDALDAARADGARVTAVSPGIFKAHVDSDRVQHELTEVLPRSLEHAVRLDCPVVIAFGFARYEGEPEGNRERAVETLHRAAERVAEAGLTLAVENEPSFWIDRPDATAAILADVGHPNVGLNWDPANLHWGGRVPTHDDFHTVRPHLVNLHVKDYYPERPEAPWLPVGEGATPWARILPWIVHETDLGHVTMETHCLPLLDSSRRSLAAIRALLADAGASESSGEQPNGEELP